MVSFKGGSTAGRARMGEARPGDRGWGGTVGLWLGRATGQMGGKMSHQNDHRSPSSEAQVRP